MVRPENVSLLDALHDKCLGVFWDYALVFHTIKGERRMFFVLISLLLVVIVGEFAAFLNPYLPGRVLTASSFQMV